MSVRPGIVAVRFFLLALSPLVLVPIHAADAEPNAKGRSASIAVVRTWQIPEVALVYDLPVFWGDHFMAVVQHTRRIVALDRSTGREVWTRVVPAGIMASQITQVDDRLVVLSEHLIEGVVLSTGATDWTVELPCAPASAARFARRLAVLPCTPLSTSGYAQTKSPIVGLDIHRGQIRWQLNATRAVYWAQMGHDAFFYLDAIRRDSIGPSPGAVVAVDVSTGKVLWRRELRDAVGRLAVVGDTVVVSTSRIMGLSVETGQVKYEKAVGPDTDVNGAAQDASTELLVCDGALLVLGRAGIEVIAGETGKRRAFLRYPASRRSGTASQTRRWSLLCEGSQILMDSRLADGQQQVFIWDGKEWRPVHGLARDETIRAFVSGQIIVESEAGIAGYSLTQGRKAP